MTFASVVALILAWNAWYQLTFNAEDVTGQISYLFLHNDGSGEVEYLFKAADGTWESGSQTVDRATYDGLRVNTPIAIRYFPGNPNETRLAANPPAFHW